MPSLRPIPSVRPGFSLRSLAVILGVCTGVSAAAVDAGNPLPELEETSPWLTQGHAHAAIGFRENLLLSAFNPMDRWFGKTEAEGLAFRDFRSGTEAMVFGTAEWLRYISPVPDADDELQATLHAEGRWSPSRWLQLTLSQQGYYQDMVLDISSSEAIRYVAPLTVRGAITGISPKLLLPCGLSLSPAASWHRSDFAEYAGDYAETKWAMKVAWDKLKHLRLSGTWATRARAYDERSQTTAGGRPLEGTLLEYDITEWRLQGGVNWRLLGAWVATASFGELTNRDNGAGYFDYDRRSTEVELEWQRKRWLASAAWESDDDEYRVQTVGIGIAPPARWSKGTSLQFRAEFKLSERFTLLGEHERERRRSNEAEFAYNARTSSAGVQWHF